MACETHSLPTMTIQKTITAGVFSSALLICQSQGATLASDDFSYDDGRLVPNGGWDIHSGRIDQGLLVSGGAAVVQHGTPSEDANFTFAPQTAGVLTATFDVIVNDDTVIGAGGTDFEYFAHFMTRGSFNFRSRLDLVAPTVGGDYSFGLSSSSSTAQATLASDFSFGDTIPVSLSFDLADGMGSLTVGGETISGDASDSGQSLDAFAFRQSDSSNNETITVDNLVITTNVPEPSSALLSGVALLGLLRRRR